MLHGLATLCVGIVAYAQNPYTLLSKNYSLEFENESVRVSRVRHSPGDRLAEHSHPALPTVYIYLTDGGPIRFTHKTPKFTVERPPVTAGMVRFNRNAQVETHEVEYLGDAPAEYLRVELKTEPGRPHRDARLRSDADFPWEDEQVRIRRVKGNAPSLMLPAVVVDVPARQFRWIGQMPPAEPFQVPHMFVIIELKTGPSERRP